MAKTLYSNTSGPSLIPGQGTKLPCATTKTKQSQINIFFNLLKNKIYPAGWVGGGSREDWASNAEFQPTGHLTFGEM